LADRSMVLVLGGLMVMVGLAFKLSAVPFHFWCPDVFEGASAEVNAFLSIASKAAALALLVRVAVGFGYAAPDRGAPPIAVATATSDQHLEAAKPKVILAAATSPALPTVPLTSPSPLAALSGVRNFMAVLVAFIAAITCTFGNLAAYGQTNIKRLLAYSTIAHAGYMMMPVAAGLVLMGVAPDASQRAFAAIPFYASIYLFMNLGAFAIVAFLRNTLRSEQIVDYAGLLRSAPGITLCLAAILFSLVGLPPLAGFAGKYAIFWALVDGIRNNSARGMMITLLVVAGLNTAISLFYYLRVIKVMTFEPEPYNRPPFSFPLVSLHGAYVAAVTLPVLLLGIWWNDLYVWAQHAAVNLLQ
jgi:NADH-quinone oxidoreductase subunit N